jgi:hypothetical protein
MHLSVQYHVPADVSQGKNTDAHRSKDWVGTRTGLGLFENEKIPSPTGIRTPFAPGPSLVVIPNASLALYFIEIEA